MPDDRFRLTLGAALDTAAAHWRQALQLELVARGAMALGASADVLAAIPVDGIAQAALAERLDQSKQAVGQSLDQLEARGLVRREPDPADRRAKQVTVTLSGHEALAIRRAVERELERRYRHTLGNKTFKRLRKALRRVNALPPPSRE